MRTPHPVAAARRAIIAGAGVVAACAPAPQRAPAVVATPAPAATPRQVDATDWRDAAFTPGTWAYRQDARGSLALFGADGADALLLLRCDRAAHVLFLSRAGSATAPLAIRTTALARDLAVRPTGGSPAYVAAVLDPRDPLLDAVAFSRGRFAVEQAGAPPLIVPPWAEVQRVVEDCRG